MWVSFGSDFILLYRYNQLQKELTHSPKKRSSIVSNGCFDFSVRMKLAVLDLFNVSFLKSSISFL